MKNTITTLLLAVIITAANAAAETLMVRVENIEDVGKGILMVVVYNDEKTYAKPKGIYKIVKTEPISTVTTVAVRDLPKGRYAVVAFHDKNGNGDMDTILGKPTEKYGFSNASGIMPNWNKHSFELDGDMSVTVKFK
jgi:uncharacterized protein (DUF2141 family)